jgi:type IV secretory pathway VirJ component
MPMRSALAVDLGKWERKATKALSAGKSAAVSFDSEAISPALAAAIGGALEGATDADAVRRVFRDAAKRDSRAFYAQGDPNAGSMRPITVNVAAPVINVSNQMPDQPPPTVNVAPAVVNVAAAEVKIPDQPAPIVNVAAPNVSVAAPVVNVAAPDAPSVTVNVPRIAREDQVVTRDRDGNLKGSTTTVTYEGDK